MEQLLPVVNTVSGPMYNLRLIMLKYIWHQVYIIVKPVFIVTCSTCF